jgi:hypothetical protein
MLEAFGLERATATSKELYTVYRRVYELLASQDTVPDILRQALMGAVTEAYDKALTELTPPDRA